MITRQDLAEKIRQTESERQAVMVSIIPQLQRLAYLEGQLALLSDLTALAGDSPPAMPHAAPVD